MLNDDAIYVTFTLSLENTDIVLNALEEKALNVQNLRQNIYDVASRQVEIIKQQNEQKLMIEESLDNKKGTKQEIMEDIKLICKDCGKEFNFTKGEQKFYEEKGFALPIRCKECRNVKKARNLNMEAGAPGNDFEAMLKKFQENTIKL